MLLHAFGSLGAVITLGLIFCVPKRFLIYSGFTGMVGWCVYQILLGTGFDEMFSMFLPALLVAVVSHLFARFFKAPVTIFLVPGILPLVPGVGMYRIVYSILQEQSAAASYYFLYTLQTAAMIAIAIFITDTFFKIINRKHQASSD
ncbi:threonine/serine exporter family protein [Hominifimenecus sp. rT4P-3]|uniref:threonine/serine exporter family protein n=1 Tax=Hominifimenecus sp. rT4P-3 TaxID=3242979 RepID=UPI003DA287B9